MYYNTLFFTWVKHTHIAHVYTAYVCKCAKLFLFLSAQPDVRHVPEHLLEKPHEKYILDSYLFLVNGKITFCFYKTEICPFLLTITVLV